VEIHRFGPGHRRALGTPGSQGAAGQTIWDDPRANVSELALARRALVPPHTATGTTLLVVVSGGGWIQVGDERIRISHGEAVSIPPGVPHGAWTDGSEMRLLVVELAEAAAATATVLDGLAEPIVAEDPAPSVTPADGALAERPVRRDEHDETEGEPW